MSTRSRIAIAIKNGKQTTYKSIYCHSDGYPEGVGKVLATFYTTRRKIEKLIKRGDLSVLNRQTGSNWPLARLLQKNASIAYRDRGDKHTEAIEASGIEQLREQAQHCFAEYLYIWRDKYGWQCEAVNWPEE